MSQEAAGRRPALRRSYFKDFRVISFEQFQQYADDGHTLIPVVREVLSDLDTPLSVYLKLADGTYTYLFESVEGGAVRGLGRSGGR